MARRRLAALGALALAAAAVGVVIGAGSGADDEHPDTRSASRARPVKRLSIERQVGELLVMSFDGPRAPPYIRRRLARGEGTGAILFARNASNATDLRHLTRALQRAARGRALIATDQEGGSLRSFPFAAPQESASSLTDAPAARASAAGGARDLHALGVNVNLAPVADVAGIQGSIAAGRSYPGGPAEVAPLVAAAVRGMAAGQVGATAKHFPGLGRAVINTDDAPVTIATGRPELERTDLVPFRAAIAARVPIVMVSHALYPTFDADRIASQSGPVIEGLLRRDLRFKGVVVTDSIEAQAVLSRSSVAVAAERSVQAGADLILMTGSGSWNAVQPRLVRRARRDARFRARVMEAAARVRSLKRRLKLSVSAPREDGR